MNFSRRLAGLLMKTDFVRRAVRENADLSGLRKRPSGKMITGLICIALSYIFCWPLISALGVLFIYIRKPGWIVIITPAIWTASHFLCMFGLYLCGAEHTTILFKWLARVYVEKHLPEAVPDRTQNH